MMPTRATSRSAALVSRSASHWAGILQSGWRSPSTSTIAPGSASSTLVATRRHSDQSRSRLRSTGAPGAVGAPISESERLPSSAAPTASQDVDRHVAHLFQGAAAALPTGARGAGSGHLQAPGVGHQSLATVNGPAVRRGFQAHEGPKFSGREELEVATVRV